MSVCTGGVVIDVPRGGRWSGMEWSELAGGVSEEACSERDVTALTPLNVERGMVALDKESPASRCLYVCPFSQSCACRGSRGRVVVA